MATINSRKIFYRGISLTGGVLGLVQGVIWTSLTIFCILAYTNAISFRIENTYSYFLTIYTLFLQDEENGVNIYITAKNFLIFVSLLLPLSITWIILSFYITWVGCHNKWSYCKKYRIFLGWSLNTILISIIDGVFTILLAMDFFKNRYSSHEIQIAYTIILLFASRGVLFWLINVVVAGFLLYFYVKDIKEDTVPLVTEFINGFGKNNKTSRADNLWISPSTDLIEYQNNGYVEDTFSSNIPTTANNYENESTSENHLYTMKELPRKSNMDNSKNLNLLPFNNIQSNRVANLPPLKLQPSGPYIPDPDYDIIASNHKNKNGILSAPNIPDPDYSPPGSPRSKSILRNKSNYE